jgi:hypothetical protein
LDSFIKTEARRSSTNGDDSEELPFDLETAIRVCRQAGYFEHASYLAKKYERHEDYLRIQIEDAGNYKDALLYLRRLGPEATESNLARYGRTMLENLPDETTQLFIDLCTISGTLIMEVEGSILNDSRSATPPATPSVATLSAVKAHPAAPARKLSPRLYFAHFVDHLTHFVKFLETVALRRWGQSVDEQGSSPAPALSDNLPEDEQTDDMDQVAVWNTLLELYLTLPLPGTDDKDNLREEERVLREKALRLLNSETVPYDPTHALVLCSSRGYTRGLELLWEKMGMHEHVLRFWMDRDKEGTIPGASAEVVQRLKLYGAMRPHLYPLVLRYLTSTPELLSRHTADVADVLEHIEKEKIIPPLGVIQVLTRNGVASVGMVKEWLITGIKLAREEIDTVNAPHQALLESQLTRMIHRTNN